MKLKVESLNPYFKSYDGQLMPVRNPTLESKLNGLAMNLDSNGKDYAAFLRFTMGSDGYPVEHIKVDIYDKHGNVTSRAYCTDSTNPISYELPLSESGGMPFEIF